MVFFKKYRRKKVSQQHFSSEWESIISRNVPYYNRLQDDDRQELKGHILVFLDEKRFEGMEGLKITDEMRVTIAAQACMLLLHRDTDYYPKLDTILVYPHRYVALVTRRMPDGTVREVLEHRLGESWSGGQMVLSWDDVKRGAADIRDGHNVVFHEFAHQLDAESGSTRGDPVLPQRSMYGAWARVLGNEYGKLIDDLEHHRRVCINSYAATSPAEFFAVVTEVFFEQPARLKSCYPDLYEQMRLFYRQDPLSNHGRYS